MELFLAMFARTLLIKAPEIIDWLAELRQSGATEVTELDMANLMAKWDKNAEDFFGTPPAPPPE